MLKHSSKKEEEFLVLMKAHEGIIRKVSQLYEPDPFIRQDLFQEIVIQLWKNFEKFRGESSFSTWVYRVAINTAISAFRKAKKKKLVNVDEVVNATETIDTQQEQLKDLYQALYKLTELERTIVLLYLEDKTYKEMEEILGMKEGALRVRMTRLKEKLKSILKTQYYGAE